jgi:hypothetical protein
LKRGVAEVPQRQFGEILGKIKTPSKPAVIALFHFLMLEPFQSLSLSTLYSKKGGNWGCILMI